MGIIAGYMVPHPPMIVPDIGKGSEDSVAETTAAYEVVAREIAELKPDTIIITSPHSVMYSDYFHISPGKSAKGDFGEFRAPNIGFGEEYDWELVNRISEIADKNVFPAGIEGERIKKLDHGTMVPLYFIRRYYGGGKIIRVGLSGLSLVDHYILGEYIRQAVDELGRRAVFVASGDLSHKLKEYGPYGFAPEGPTYDKRIMEAAGRAAFGEMLAFDPTLCEKAAECGHRSFVIMAGAFDGIKVEAKVLSHQDVTGVGYGICTFHPVQAAEGKMSEDRCFLNDIEAELKASNSRADSYVKLARFSLESYIREHRKIRIPGDIPEELMSELPEEVFSKRAGIFVSIHKQGELRGCIGTILPVTDCIAQEIADNAISASTKDSRFNPILESELKWLKISVDVLGEPENIPDKGMLDVKRYGVIVSSGYKRGLLLPDLDGVDDVDTQISIAMRKAGIKPTDKYSLQRFEVIRHM